MTDWTSNADKLRATFVSFFDTILNEAGLSLDIPRVNENDLKRFARTYGFQERTAVAAWTLLLMQINPITGGTLDVTYTTSQPHPRHAQVGLASLKAISRKIETVQLPGRMGPRTRRLLVEWTGSLRDDAGS